jgi:hypothetical protein
MFAGIPFGDFCRAEAIPLGAIGTNERGAALIGNLGFDEPGQKD